MVLAKRWLLAILTIGASAAPFLAAAEGKRAEKRMERKKGSSAVRELGIMKLKEWLSTKIV